MNNIKYTFIRKIDAYLNKKTKVFLIFISSILTLIIAFLDYVTGINISVSIFYLIPISLVIWRISFKYGILFSILSAIFVISVRIILDPTFNYFIRFWNMLVELGIFLAFSYIMNNFKKEFEYEKLLARKDPLTGVYNKRAFKIIAKDEINRANRYKHTLTAAYIDLDNFKLLNDTFGHNVGDQALIALTRTIKKNIRSSDVIARLGGDEFVILLPETDSDKAQFVFNRLQNAFNEIAKKKGWSITISLGVVTFNHRIHSVKTILENIDKLMYQAKKEGKNIIKYKMV